MLVMLDLDNTLGDRDAAVSAWLDEFAEQHALDSATVAWIRELDNDGYSPRDEVFGQIRQRLGLVASADELVVDYRRRVVELTRPTSGARECLVALRAAGHRLAIVTNGSSGQQHAKITRLGFDQFVDAVIVSGDLEIKKPDRRIFEAAAEAAGGSLDGACMVGDAVTHDIAAAAALGMDTIWIRRGRSWPLDDVAPTYIVDAPGEIPALLG